MIDPHVHLRDFEQSGKETIEHGLSVAERAGIGRVFDMPNCSPALTDRESIMRRLRLAENPEKKYDVKYHLYGGLTDNEEQIKKIVFACREFFPRVVGLKMFASQSTGNMGIVAEERQRFVFECLSAFGFDGVLAVHCEKESLFHPELYNDGHYETHSAARPAESETESVKDIVKFAGQSGFKGTLHIAHVSAADTVAYIDSVKSKGVKITYGITPHHALLTDRDAADGNRFLKVNPPLRSERDRKAVYTALLSGSASWIESDHAPHGLADKRKGASGIPGFSGNLILVRRLLSDGISQKRLQALTSCNISEIFGIEMTEDDGFILQIDDELIQAIEKEYSFCPWK